MDLVTKTGWATGQAWADYDNDGDFDVFITRGYPDPESCILYRNMGNDKFEHIDQSPVLDIKGGFWNAGFGDFDNDGDLDLSYCDLDHLNYLFENDGTGNYTRVRDNIIVTADIVNKIEIQWPSGRKDIINKVKSDQFITLTE